MLETKATCVFCKLIFDMKLDGPVDRVECPHCLTMYEIEMINSTIPELATLQVRILKEGEKKYDRR